MYLLMYVIKKSDARGYILQLIQRGFAILINCFMKLNFFNYLFFKHYRNIE